ncbi:MAG: hypothetical protein RLZZ458_1194, partial [Planctomycetota bacterium]
MNATPVDCFNRRPQFALLAVLLLCYLPCSASIRA